MSDATPNSSGKQGFQLLPALTSDEYESLKSDLAENGQREPICTWGAGGPIVDGHHRERACRELGLEPRYEPLEFEDDTAAKSYALRVNLTRRQLSPLQWTAARQRQRELYAEYRRRGFRQVQAAGLVGVPEGTAARWDSESKKKDDRTSEPEKQSAAASPESSNGHILRPKNRSVVGDEAKPTPAPPADNRVKLTDEQKRHIYELVTKHGYTHRHAADEHKITERHVGRVVSREHERQTRRREDAEAKKKGANPVDIRRGRFQDVLTDLDDGSVDLIITDPPYGPKYNTAYNDLAEFAARKLKSGGSCIAYSGQSNLPEVLESMGEHLRYWWTLALMHKHGGQQLPGKWVMVEWKPLVWFVKDHREGRDYVADRMSGSKPRKDLHEWAQGVDEIAYLIEQLTRPGQLVVDPFAGSGSFGYAAHALGRNFIGAESGEHKDAA